MRSLLLFLLLLFPFLGIGQTGNTDLIYTRSRDSLACNIIEVRSQYLVYNITAPPNDTMYWEHVENYEYDYFLKGEASDFEGEDFLYKKENPLFTFSLFGGMLSAGIPKEIRDGLKDQVYEYRSDLAVGQGYGFQITHGVYKELFIGLVASYQHWQFAEENLLDTLPGSSNPLISGDDRITMTTVDMVFGQRKLSSNGSIALYYGATAGFGQYKRESTGNIPEYYHFTTKKAGFNTSLFFQGDFFISEQLSFLAGLHMQKIFLGETPANDPYIYNPGTYPHQLRYFIQLGLTYHIFDGK